MASIIIFRVSINSLENSNNVGFSEWARTSDMTNLDEDIYFVTPEISITATTGAMNSAIEAAAIEAAAAAGHTVLAPDKKTVLGGAV